MATKLGKGLAGREQTQLAGGVTHPIRPEQVLCDPLPAFVIDLPFIQKRIKQQADYIQEVQHSDRTAERKRELILSAMYIYNYWHCLYLELIAYTWN